MKRDEGGEGGKKMARREERWGGEEEGDVRRGREGEVISGNAEGEERDSKKLRGRGMAG